MLTYNLNTMIFHFSPDDLIIIRAALQNYIEVYKILSFSEPHHAFTLLEFFGKVKPNIALKYTEGQFTTILDSLNLYKRCCCKEDLKMVVDVLLSMNLQMFCEASEVFDSECSCDDELPF